MAPGTRERIAAFLLQHPGASSREIKTALFPQTEGSIRQSLKRMRSGHYLTIEDGRYTLTNSGFQLARDNSHGNFTKQRFVTTGDAYHIHREIAQLRQKHGKKAFDAAYEVVKGIDP
jgi:hypothetical protein